MKNYTRSILRELSSLVVAAFLSHLHSDPFGLFKVIKSGDSTTGVQVSHPTL